MPHSSSFIPPLSPPGFGFGILNEPSFKVIIPDLQNQPDLFPIYNHQHEQEDNEYAFQHYEELMLQENNPQYSHNYLMIYETHNKNQDLKAIWDGKSSTNN
ncbi:hypothetical protein O181_112673 [Austropuccinia psidii MF-1]|uniref:Uncharacterized protein n=1 Tax=Austropuccinia psidii MF-1 TaxID=1389203 RepID=A0A9Q3PSX1_9BASI|nr:hypothetical protein [Austropuccinia psidii MF-1]